MQKAARRKTTEHLGMENKRNDPQFRKLSQTLLQHTVTFTEEVLVPILSYQKNRTSWPGYVSQDMKHHAEIMKSTPQIVKGLMSGRTHVPICTSAVKPDLYQIYAENK